MEVDRVELLSRHGIDYPEAMERFGGNARLYERLVVKYLNDPHFDALELALAHNNLEAAYHEAHSLKGVAGNLSFTELYKAASRMTDALKYGDVAAARALIISTREAHTSVIGALSMMARK